MSRPNNQEEIRSYGVSFNDSYSSLLHDFVYFCWEVLTLDKSRLQDAFPPLFLLAFPSLQLPPPFQRFLLLFCKTRVLKYTGEFPFLLIVNLFLQVQNWIIKIMQCIRGRWGAGLKVNMQYLFKLLSALFLRQSH